MLAEKVAQLIAKGREKYPVKGRGAIYRGGEKVEVCALGALLTGLGVDVTKKFEDVTIVDKILSEGLGIPEEESESLYNLVWRANDNCGGYDKFGNIYWDNDPDEAAVKAVEKWENEVH